VANRLRTTGCGTTMLTTGLIRAHRTHDRLRTRLPTTARASRPARPTACGHLRATGGGDTDERSATAA
jgi:hypothetical protein